MTRPRTPTNVLELSGAFDKNPQRRRRDPKSAGPLGSAPVELDEQERQLWNEFRRKAPEKVLTAADRFLLEILCRLMARQRFPGKSCGCNGKGVCPTCNGTGFVGRAPLSNGELTALMQGISKLGFTPVDRAKISVGSGKEQDDNPFAKFTSGRKR
jgi:phage terminase small subunit